MVAKVFGAKVPVRKRIVKAPGRLKGLVLYVDTDEVPFCTKSLGQGCPCALYITERHIVTVPESTSFTSRAGLGCKTMVRKKDENAMFPHLLNKPLDHLHIPEPGEVWRMLHVIVVCVSPTMYVLRNNLILIYALYLEKEADSVEAVRC